MTMKPPRKKPIEERIVHRTYPIALEDVLNICRAEMKLRIAENKLKDIAQSRKITSKKGATETNKKKKQSVEARQSKIKDYLINNPNPNLKGYSLEGFLIKTLELKKPNGINHSERTINRDLNSILTNAKRLTH